jgi:MFS-type transporter involved in bile tolerance (Atg22 family)
MIHVAVLWVVTWILYEFDVYVTVHCVLLIIKPTRCTNFTNLFLEWNSTCFGQFLCPSTGVFHCTHSSGICHTGLLIACEQDQDGTAAPSWFCLQAVKKLVWHIPLLCVQWKTPDDVQRNCPKHVEFHSKNKFEKLMHLVGLIIRMDIVQLFLVGYDIVNYHIQSRLI